MTVHLAEVQQDLLGCLSRVEAGETLVILRENRPVAELKPVSRAAAAPRPFGLCAGEFSVPEDFDAPLPEDA
jgi:antitoxin (DNA-binding transcriptional repressor) of toxin-antitoxin stability system